MHYVHATCLSKWQRTIVLSLRGGPQQQAQENRHRICQACNTPFATYPKSRCDILKSVIGEELSDVSDGRLLIATKSSSERKIPATIHSVFAALLDLKRAHWRHSVYLVFSVSGEGVGDADDDTILAINLTRHMDNSTERPIPNEIILASDANDDLSIDHFNGGPVKWSVMRHGAIVINQTAEILLTELDDFDHEYEMFVIADSGADVDGGLEIGRCTVVGRFADILAFARAKNVTKLKSFSGYAQWNRTQLLGEIARGSWGLAKPDINVSDVITKENPDELWAQLTLQSIEMKGEDLLEL